MINKQERGAIMLEVLAVLALIGVMGPMLYKQVLSRNQEISNVNIAAEMRAIKEAMSAAIAADGAILAELCGTSDGTDLKECTAGTAAFQTAVGEFLPIGMEHIMDTDYGYDVGLYSYTVTLANGEDYPVVVGVVGGTDLASDWSLKRAARVANLIGTDGGIVQNDDLVGAGGSWQLTGLGDDWGGNNGNYVVATTALDTFDPDLGATDPNAVAVPKSLAFGDLHAWNYFSVGNAGTAPCYQLNRELDSNAVAQDDSIYGAGTENCDPLFWVGAKGEDDASKSGQVYVKNNLYVGRDNSGNKHAFAFEVDGTQDHGDNTVSNNRFVVYNIGGDKKLTINDKGQIIAEGVESLEVKDAQTTVSNAETGEDVIMKETKNLDYGLDPANTSVLNDVRLASRGGARLSDILPNYISKGVYQLSSTTTGSNQSWSTEIKKPVCPENYVAAVIVTPLKWGVPVQSITVPANSSHNLTVNNNKVSGTIDAVTVPKVNITQYALAIEITGGSGADNRTDSTSETPWTVTIGYKNDSGSWAGNLKNGEIQALAQTYCVYTGTPDIPDDKLIKE